MIKLNSAYMANEHTNREKEKQEREQKAREYSKSVRKSRKQEKMSFLNFLNNATGILAGLLLLTSILLSGM